MSRVFEVQQAKLHESGINLPPTKIDYANAINTHAALRETLLVREERAERLQRLEQNALQCNTSCTFPFVLLVPNVAGWSPIRPVDLLRSNLTLVRFDEIEMKQTIDQAIRTLQKDGVDAASLRTMFFKVSTLDRIHIWALSAVFLFGGVFMGNNVERQNDFDSIKPAIGYRASPSSVFFAYNSDNASSPDTLNFLAAVPRSPILACLLTTISGCGGSLSIHSDGVLERLEETLLTKDFMKESGWFETSLSVESGQATECAKPIRDWTPTSLSDSNRHGSVPKLFIRSFPRTPKQLKKEIVEIRARFKSDIAWTRTPKVRLQNILRTNGGEPGWFCNRCLNWAFMGSFEKCSSVCPSRYKEIICSPSARKTTGDFDVVVAPNATEIPKIIHQTWFDDITADRYTQLSRLQASWRSSGWDYRFYTDDDAREYIEHNYPKPFLDSFEVLVHGAYKADFFRYLVLLREGGIYADVDVMLETNLDNFITEGMSFFAPRDIPCEYAGEAFCLWNGVLGSSAGNPILIRAVERLVNLIQDRADAYDMEREVCLHEGSRVPLWKIRAQPLLFLSGPCGLGLALNEALFRPSLESLPIGYVQPMNKDDDNDYGDAFILVGDKYDLGQFRFSDSERNIIFASTDLKDISTSARIPSHLTEADRYRQSKLRQPQPHYSASKKGVTVWGSANVYKDDLASDVAIKMHLKYSR